MEFTEWVGAKILQGMKRGRTEVTVYPGGRTTTKRARMAPRSRPPPPPPPQPAIVVTERKYFDSEVSAVALVSSATAWAGMEFDPTTLNTLFAPVTGDDFNNRSGRKVQVLGIKIKGHINIQAQSDQVAADNAALIRILLVQDQQTNAAQLNSEDVITSGAASAAIDMFQNPAFFGRFRVLQDRFFSLQSPSITFDGTNIEQSGLVRPFKMNIRFTKPVVVHFNATNGGTVADIIDNSFHIIANSTSIQTAPTINYKCRTTFIDV